MVSFFSENYYIYHYSNTISNAFIFMVILILFSILLPFFTNLGTVDKFWKPNKVYSEHPIVQFKDEFLIQLSNSKGESASIDSNNLSDENSALTSCSIETQDYSNKDIINLIKIKGTITSSFSFNELRFFIFFDYYMTENVNIHLRSNAHIFYSINNGYDKLIKFSSNGDLILKQNKGLIETYFIQNENSDSNLNDEINTVRDKPFSRNDNYYFEYKKNFISVQKAREEERGGNFEFEIIINIPYYQDIIVQLPGYTNLKNKWVLYSILFFPTLYVCYLIMELVINNQIFKTRIKSDIPIKI